MNSTISTSHGMQHITRWNVDYQKGEQMKLGDLTIQFPGSLDADYVRDSLLQYHLFPAIKDMNDEVPPIFSSQGLTASVAEDLFNLTPGKTKCPPEERFEPFAPMRYTALKFNGAIRSMQVPHPVPYSRLVMHIHRHWKEVNSKLVSGNSRVKPEKIQDGRLFSMNYGNPELRATDEARNFLGSTHIATADISNFFPSIYTHAIDWAIRTKTICKKNTQSRSEWSHQLDSRIRDLQEKESIGVAIGPGTSNLVSEIILQQIDKSLDEQGFKFVRFIDDYTCYADSKEKAQSFIYELNQHLYEYRLSLNHRKTRITDVGEFELDGWIEEVRAITLLPDDSTITLVRKIRALENLSNKYPAESVLNFGLGTLLRNAKEFSDEQIVGISYELGRIVWLAPATISRIVRIVSRRVVDNGDAKDHFKNTLLKVIDQANQRREADTILWALYGIREMGYTFTEKYLIKRTEWCPLIGAAALAMFPDQSIEFLSQQMQALPLDSNTELDEHWLLRYELWRQEALTDWQLSSSRELTYFRTFENAGTSFFSYP